jgi:hypothetical protein
MGRRQGGDANRISIPVKLSENTTRRLEQAAGDTPLSAWVRNLIETELAGEGMKRLSFTKQNKSGDLLHIEVPGAVVNIRVNLTTEDGREVTRVDVLPDDKTRGGDWQADTRHPLGIRLIHEGEQ